MIPHNNSVLTIALLISIFSVCSRLFLGTSSDLCLCLGQYTTARLPRALGREAILMTKDLAVDEF